MNKIFATKIEAIRMTNFLKDKEQTKRRLINAVGEILKTEGPEKLGYRNIARKAGVDKQLIYRYFKTLDTLIETYIVENDYWMNVSEHIGTFLENDESDLKKLIIGLLQNQFKYFISREEMQRLIAWEISTKSPLMRSIHNVRESTGQKFFELIDDSVNPNKVNFRAIAALLVGGIYYAVLHTRYNGNVLCDINVNSDDGKKEIAKTIEQIITWAFAAAKS